MKITVSGSMKHADKMVDIFRKLEELGHTPLMHEEVFGIADGSAKKLIEGISEDHAKVKKEHDFIRYWYSLICSGDALIVCNFDKNGIKNYIGGNTLMEIGFAYVNNKKIFLYNPIPEELAYSDEIKAMVDVILEGDLNLIQK